MKKINILVSFLLIIFVVVTISLPAIIGGKESTFYSIDPDIMYVGNAISYVKNKQLHYFDHPGVFSIILLSKAYIPLRLYAKYFSKEGFVSWSFTNYDFLFHYSRVYESVILTIGLVAFLCSLYLITRKYSSIVLGMLLLLIFPPFYNLGFSISAETTSFMLSAFVILFVCIFINNNKYIYLWLATLISGIAFGNRITAISITIMPLLAILFFTEKNISKKITNLLKGFIIIFIGFIISLWPLRDRVIIISKHILKLSSGTEIHGGGKQVFFELESYIRNFTTGFYSNPKVFIIVILSIIISIMTTLIMKNKLKKYVATLSVSILLFFLAFAKFPLLHYQLINYLIFCFILIFNICNLSNKYLVVTSLILIYLATPIFKNSLKILSINVNNAIKLKELLDSNYTDLNKLFSWSNTKEFATIWTNDWAGQIFEKELKKNKLSEYDDKNIDWCNRQLVINKIQFEKIITKNPNLILNYSKLPSVDLFVVKMPSCTNIY